MVFPPEICEHGSMKRKCIVCESIEQNKEIAALRAEVESLHGSLSDSNYRCLKFSDRIKALEEELEKEIRMHRNTAASLDELRRRAGREG